MLKRMRTKREDLSFFFENGSRGYTYQGMLWASFMFGTGRNHECDDIIDCFREELEYCLRKLSSLFVREMKRCDLHRLVVNRNSSSIAMLLIFSEECSDDKHHSFVVTPNDMYLIKNASHKCYLHLLENGNPLVTFASNKREGRGVFDGERIYFGEKIKSSLPETLQLTVSGNSFSSRYFRGNESQLIVGSSSVERLDSIKKKGIVVVNF